MANAPSSRNPERLPKRPFRSWLWAFLIGMTLLTFASSYFGAGKGAPISYTELKQAISEGRVERVVVTPTTITGEMKGGTEGEPSRFRTIRIEDDELLRDLASHGVEAEGALDSSGLGEALGWLLPLVALPLFFLFLLRRAGTGGPGAALSIGKSKAKIYMETDVGVTLDDVAGVDEAKEELQEVIDFLENPEKLKRLGGRIPKGILLVGPPGTGKTLLARAVAGEARVPFFSISGSEFVEMFVGVGAARVRDLFQQAREKAPCIIFIDELDALGKARGVGPMAHEEREQTLNQLLVELDGFDPRTGVILMAASNRPEILDPALLRSGRFDRHVLVDRPDKAGRLAILRVHARKVKLASEDDLETIAAMTPGLVGADLANVLNEAALLAVRRDKETITLAELEEAVERIIAGLEKKSRVLNPSERERVAYHELGHAIVATCLPGTDVVQKISIIPRGIAALGYTLQRPTEDRFLMTEPELRDKIAIYLGGRIAEEIVFGTASTGAEDDLRKATDIAASMVRAFGMSRKLGLVSFERQRQALFLEGSQSGSRGDYSEDVARTIDEEMRAIIDEQYARVSALLREQQPLMLEAAQVLLAKETISGDELREIAERLGRGDCAKASGA